MKVISLTGDHSVVAEPFALLSLCNPHLSNFVEAPAHDVILMTWAFTVVLVFCVIFLFVFFLVDLLTSSVLFHKLIKLFLGILPQIFIILR